jgi:hypothetical protein
LKEKDLSNSIVVMKKFNAKRRFMAAANAVLLANRLHNKINKSRSDVDEGEKNSVSSNDGNIVVGKQASLLDLEAIKDINKHKNDDDNTVYSNDDLSGRNMVPSRMFEDVDDDDDNDDIDINNDNNNNGFFFL